MARSGFLSIAISASTAMAAVITIGAPGAVAAAPKTHIVIIDKMKFGPTPINVRVGDVILWVNKDIFRHHATARDRSFNIDLEPADRGKTVLKRSGLIPFFRTEERSVGNELGRTWRDGWSPYQTK